MATNLHSREVTNGIINITKLATLLSFNSFLRKQVSEKAAQAAREALHKEYRHVYLAQPDRGGARVVPQRVAAKKQEKRRTNKKEK